MLREFPHFAGEACFVYGHFKNGASTEGGQANAQAARISEIKGPGIARGVDWSTGLKIAGNSHFLESSVTLFRLYAGNLK